LTMSEPAARMAHSWLCWMGPGSRHSVEQRIVHEVWRCLRMKVLVVGASGAAGIAVQKELSERGHELRCVDVLPPRYDMAELLELFGYDPAVPQAERIYGDVLKEEVAEAVVQGMDACVYCALPVWPWRDTPSCQFPINLIGPCELVRRGVQAGLRKFVYASSVSVNLRVSSQSEKVLTEDDPPELGSCYALSKWLAEEMLREFARVYGLRCLCLRLGTIRPHYRMLRPRPDRYRQFFVDVRDVARAFRLALENETVQFAVLNIVSKGEPQRCSWARAREVLGFETEYNGREHFMELFRKQRAFLERHGSLTAP